MLQRVTKVRLIDIEGLGAVTKIERTQLSKVRRQTAFSSPQLGTLS